MEKKTAIIGGTIVMGTILILIGGRIGGVEGNSAGIYLGIIGLILFVIGFSFWNKKKKEQEKREENRFGAARLRSEPVQGIVTPKEEAIRALRQRIIESVENERISTVTLTQLLGPAAKACFPEGDPWYVADFKLALAEMNLYVLVSTYPNQFGATRDTSFSLTPARFHEIAKEYGFPRDLQYMESAEDWKRLMNDELTEALDAAKKKREEDQERAATAHRIQYALVIPAVFEGQVPEMAYEKVSIMLDQMYGDTKILLSQKDGSYLLARKKFYFRTTALLPTSWSRVLKPAEAVWIEKRIETSVNDPSMEEWKSWAGRDSLTVEISRQGQTCFKMENGTPLKKYIDLLNLMETMATYESFSEVEAKNLSITRRYS